MCQKCPTRDELIIIISMETRGKTLQYAEWIVNCDDFPDDYIIPDWLGQWATYFFKNTPITKADLREALNTIIED